VVPLTIERDGPYGQGSVQRFIAADFEQHYFTLREDAKHHEHLKRICAFDLIANNADRKSGHCLLAEDGAIYGIDNGLCFHVEPKLRTVIWDFGEEPVPPALRDDLRRLAASALPPALASCWMPPSARRAQAGARAREGGKFPVDSGGHRYPWPLV